MTRLVFYTAAMTTSLCSHHFRPRMLRTVSRRVALWAAFSRNGNVPAPRPPGTPPRYCSRSHRSPAPENPSPSDPSGGRGVAGAVAWPAVLEPRIRIVSIVGCRSESVYPTLVGYTPRRSPIWPTCPRDLVGFKCSISLLPLLADRPQGEAVSDRWAERADRRARAVRGDIERR